MYLRAIGAPESAMYDILYKPNKNFAIYRESQNTMINNEDLNKLFEDFYNNCYKKYSNSDLYNFNLLDEQSGSIKENSHTNILIKLLQVSIYF